MAIRAPDGANKSRNNYHYKWISSSSPSQAVCPIQLICFGHFDVSICFKTRVFKGKIKHSKAICYISTTPSTFLMDIIINPKKNNCHHPWMSCHNQHYQHHQHHPFHQWTSWKSAWLHPNPAASHDF